MSLRDKYTDEEWNAIPPFTGFHHNKIIDEISKSIKYGLDNFPNIIKHPKKEDILQKASEEIKNRCDNLISGKLNLSSFSGGMNKDIQLNKIPEIDYKFAENISVEQMLIDRIKKENKPREIIDKIVDKVYERSSNNKDCEVVIMSISDYDSLQSLYDFEVKQIEVMGFKLKIHGSLNLEEGNIEIY